MYRDMPSIGTGYYRGGGWLRSNGPPPTTNPGAGGEILVKRDSSPVNTHLPIRTAEEAIRLEEIARKTTGLLRVSDINVR